MMDEYIPRTLRQAQAQKAEAVLQLYREYPYEDYEGIIRRKLGYWKIRESDLAYQECYDAAMVEYMYSIARCALADLKHVRYYILKMIRIGIVVGLVLHDDAKNLCRENNLKPAYIDGEKNRNRY